VSECPAGLVCSVAETGDKCRFSIRMVKAFIEDFEDVGQGDLANSGMPHDFSGEIQNDGRFVRIGGPVEHPSDAKRVRDESAPIDGLSFEDDRNVVCRDDLHFLEAPVARGEFAGPPLG